MHQLRCLAAETVAANTIGDDGSKYLSNNLDAVVRVDRLQVSNPLLTAFLTDTVLPFAPDSGEKGIQVWVEWVDRDSDRVTGHVSGVGNSDGGGTVSDLNSTFVEVQTCGWKWMRVGIGLLDTNTWEKETVLRSARNRIALGIPSTKVMPNEEMAIGR